MDIKHIIIITILPIGQRDFNRFGIGYFIEQEKEVTVFNIRELIYKGSKSKVTCNIEQVQADFKYIEIKDYNALELELKKLDSRNSIIFTFLGLNYKSYNFYNQIAKYNILFGGFFVNPIPIAKYIKNEKLIDKLKRLRKFYSIKTLSKKALEKVYYEVYSKFINTKKYDFVVVAGKVGNEMKNNISLNTKIIKAHTLDKEFVVQDKNIFQISNDYIVFLDQYLPYHSDFDLIGIDNKKIADIYYEKMNSLLCFLSKKYNKEVIICAHPRSEYDKYKVWGNKKVVLFQTYEYIKKAYICITHASTSINFVVMLNKPINFIYFKEIDFYKNSIATLSNALGKDIINIDIEQDKLDNVDFLYKDENKYKEYIENYITENIEDKSYFWEKVLSELQRTFS